MAHERDAKREKFIIIIPTYMHTYMRMYTQTLYAHIPTNAHIMFVCRNLGC